MPSPHLTPIMSYITYKEKDELKELATQTNMTVSSLVRRLVTGKELPDTKRDADIKDLIKINGDLARLGNLFKLALDDGAFEATQYNKGTDIVSLVESIQSTKTVLKTKIISLKS